MIDISEYITLYESLSPWSETLLGTNKHNWEHNGDYKYVKTLLNWILNPSDDTPECIYIGKSSDSNKTTVKLPLELSENEIRQLQKLYNDIQNKNINDFNEILKKHGLVWKNINKAQLSGVSSAGNAGNQFETDFYNDFEEKWEDKIKSIVGCKEIKSKSLDGTKNNKRPYYFNSDGSITAGKPGSYNIGSIVSDITLDTDKGPIYLSLKSGKLLSFANIGCIGRGSSQIIPRSWYNSDDSKLPEHGQQLLDMLGIDTEQFKDVFKGRQNTSNSTKVRKATYEKFDVTDRFIKNDSFIKFVRSNIGCGYIMVHQNSGDDVDFIDLRSEKTLNKITDRVISADVNYAKNAKRVEVHVDMPGVWLSFDLRPSDGGPVPNRVHVRYKLK